MEMTDKRIALPDEYQFRACNKIINIKNEVGRGANCIVYDVIWEDTMGLLHLGRVKELYPIYLQMIRNSDNTLECDNENKFVEAQRRFCAAYKKNVQFKNMHGLSNSTINASEIFEMNGTYYVMMNMDEGIDYRKYSDKSLIETFKHIKALANVIKKYHEVGYLHLDVKPENVYVIPETAEHIYLFDFDSICKISELQEKNIIELSYSEGFSAPEQVQSDISKIGVKTDIYAIGAVLFYKLFNRKPTFEERRYSAHFIYKDMVFYDEALRPAFFKKLDLFLHKTLSSAVSLRWNTMDKVITALDELIELANLEDEYLIDTFTYNSSCFVGRSDELEKIHYTMGLSNVLFLSGIGGIGKTELAKKYVSEYRGEYDTVAFVYFNESIEHTVCHEMLINNMSIDEEESEKDYFERVLEVLRKTTSDKDLILLDNFDVVKDNRIEDLLKCPCKFLITTRNRNIRDWNFNEIKIDRMDSNKDLMLLFLTYNDEKYEKQEYEKIESLINFVDGHTMTVELISKYLRDTGQKPSFLYQQFMDKSGVTNTDDELVVNQRKDFNMNSENVNAHLSILFDVFGFDSASKEIISSLSLFAGIKIIRDRFEKLCKVDNVHENLDRLIRGGWIEINEKNGKISLHQVIQDLIFTKLLPTSTNCPNIVDGMYAYINENIENYSETRIRRRVFDIFSERLSGNDIPYARICLKSGKEYKIDEAINICNSVDSLEANSLLTELYMKRIEKLCACEGIWEIDLEYGKNYILKIYEQYLLAIESCRKSTNDPKELVPRYIMLGNEMDSILSSDMITVYYEDVEELDLIYQKIIELYENAGEQLQKLDIPYAEKEKLYRIICNFYSDGDYSAMYRSEHYANIKKLYKYQELLEKLIEGNIAEENRDDDRKIIYVDPDIKSYSELADMCMSEGDYETAIEMYKKGYEDGTEPFELVCSGISKAYIEMGDTRKAIKCLECVLENDKKCIANGEQFCTYSSYICIDLIKILIDCSRVDEAKKYAKELVMYKESEMCDGEKDEYLINKLLTAYWYLYLLEENEIMKSEYWNKCKCLFDLLDSMEIDEELYSFVLEYIDKEEIIDSQILAIVDRLDRWNVHHEEKKQIIHKIDQLVVKKGVSECVHISLLLKMAELTNTYPYTKIKEGYELCEDAMKIAKGIVDISPYYLNKILQVKSELMSNDNEVDFEIVVDVKIKCDYYLIAEEETLKEEGEKQVKIWKNAAYNYQYLNKYEDEVCCLKRACEILLPVLNQFDYSKFDSSLWYIWGDMVNAYLQLAAYKKARGVINDMYVGILDYYLDSHEEYDKRDIYYRIKDIASDYSSAKSKLDALRAYVLGMYVSVIEKCDKQILYGFLQDINDLKSICKEMLGKMDTIDAECIDRLIDIKEEIVKLEVEEQEYLKEIEPLLLYIENQYQNKEIEFKTT